MKKFSNQAFRPLVEELLNDAFYLKNRSKRGKISTIRQYSEIIVRKILNSSEEDFVTLGNKKILIDIGLKSENNTLLLKALKNISKIGNKCTHTQSIQKITDKDIESVLKSLFELYSYLLISYFERNRFGCNLKVVSSFSILPPIIRYITLKYLYDNDPNNLMRIDKLSLSILKSFDEEYAKEWLDERKNELSSLISVNKEIIPDLEKKFGKEVAKLIVNDAPNMYDSCCDRIKNVSETIDQKGRLYFDFESAKSLYLEKGVLEGETEEVKDFNLIMEFLYLGRKVRKNELLKEKDAYVVLS